MSGIKRDKRDAVFSRLVRERAGWRCERCGAQHDTKSQGLHCAHIFGRRARSTRWAADNAVAACYGCHRVIDGNHAEKESLARRILGDERYELIREKHHKTVKLTQADLEDIYQHMRGELQRLESERMDGKQGRLEFQCPM